MEKFEAQFNSEYEEVQKNWEILPIEILIKFIKNKWNCKTIKEKKNLLLILILMKKFQLNSLYYWLRKNMKRMNLKNCSMI